MRILILLSLFILILARSTLPAFQQLPGQALGRSLARPGSSWILPGEHQGKGAGVEEGVDIFLTPRHQ